MDPLDVPTIKQRDGSVPFHRNYNRKKDELPLEKYDFAKIMALIDEVDPYAPWNGSVIKQLDNVINIPRTNVFSRK